MEQGYLDVAERDLRDSTPLLIERVGQDNVDVGASFYTLGMLAWEQDRLAEAERDLAQAITIWRSSSARTRLVRAMADHAELLQTQGRREAAMEEIEQAQQLAIGQMGVRHPMTSDIEHIFGRMLATNGDHAGAVERLERAAQHARASRGANHLRTQSIELSLARELARSDNLRAMGTMERLANARVAGGNEPRDLRWRARAYLGEARCRANPVQARADLDALSIELHDALPQGGRLPREIDAIRAGCAPIASR